MTRGAIPIALAALALLASARGAAAAALAADRGCYASGDTMLLRGTAFTPDVAITVPMAMGSPTTDDAGSFETTVRAPTLSGLAPRTVRVAAVDTSGLLATVDVSVVSAAFATNLPLAGRPRTRTWWRFAGFFDVAKPIYGHFRTHGRTVRTYRFGAPQGPCGILAVRAPRLPVRRVRPGRWRLKLDQEPTYSARAPGRIVRFRVSPD